MKKVYIKTYGCQMNERDSEALSVMLSTRGYFVVPNEADADVVLLNTCAVREQAEQKAIGKAQHLVSDRRRGLRGAPLRVGIIGCMAQNRGPELFNTIPGVDMVVGTQQIHHVPEFLDGLFAKGADAEPVLALEEEDGSQNAISQHPEGFRATAFVSIMQGCNMRCTYCIVPKTRGRERCRSIGDIVAECRGLAARGTKEITLLGQIVTSYGRREIPFVDGKSPFVQLIEAVAEIDGIERIRFTSPHPRGFKDDLVQAFARIPKLMPCVHLPVQSGSDAVLKAMNRPYSAERYLQIVDSLRKAVPHICISTDVIVGFPNESDEDFEATAEVFRRVRFDMAYVFKYSPRPGAPADGLEDNIPEDVKEQRNQVLLGLLGEYSMECNQSYVGKEQEVLVEGRARRGEDRWMGRNPTGRKVIFPAKEDLTGQLVMVHVDSATVTTLEGSLVTNAVSAL
ncbi:MAG: tRNA (N6-isopentenyl adenosine(37)-C2)-methylthiotransferase MiaB [Opitutales bacterium]|nr:tRNA (N6-isopentenyl adenosine(37)-C2)-methylthiotransferase MiaB [Opitutales bacterium]